MIHCQKTEGFTMKITHSENAAASCRLPSVSLLAFSFSAVRRSCAGGRLFLSTEGKSS